MKPAEIRTTVILLAIIFGVSTILFFGKALFQPSMNTVSVVDSRPEPVSSEKNAISQTKEDSSRTEERQITAEKTSSASKPVTSVNTPSSEKSVKTEKKTMSTDSSPVRPPVKKEDQKTTEPERVPVSIALPSAPPEKPVPEKRKGTLIFVFDDAGHNLRQQEPFLKLPFPCTIAVLPGLGYSTEAARRVRAAGKEVILHQPMQAINLSMDPGPGAITLGMNADQIKELVRKNLAEVGPVVGINNHEGSLVTADRTLMEAVFDVTREKGIYFLDSRTNAETVAPVLARERHMTIWERAVFLDNDQETSAIIEAVEGGMKIAERKGTAIMIGHVWSNDLADILTGMYPELVSQGFSLSTIASLATNGEFDE